MKKLFQIALWISLIINPIWAATIRIENKTNNPITAGINHQGKTSSAQINPGQSKFFNTGLHGITGSFWTTNGTEWQAPINMKAIQTEGRLIIHNNGEYDFQGCQAFCAKKKGQKARMTKSPSQPTQPSTKPKTSPKATIIPPQPQPQPQPQPKQTTTQTTMTIQQIKQLPPKQIHMIAMELKNQQKYAEAIELFEAAGKKGHYDAYYELAEIYRDGIGVPKDKTKSQKYVDKAIELENKAIKEFEQGLSVF